MTFTKARFASFEEYLTADVSDLPEERCEYWDGELVPVMTESLGNGTIATFILLMLVAIDIPFELIRHNCEVEVIGKPQSRIPDLTIIDEIHVMLLKKRATITRKMPPPRLVLEVVSPGTETSEYYRRDYEAKRNQYSEIGIPEYWLVDPERSTVLIGNLINGEYQFKTFRKNQAIVSSTFPGLSLTAAQILKARQ